MKDKSKRIPTDDDMIEVLIRLPDGMKHTVLTFIAGLEVAHEIHGTTGGTPGPDEKQTA